MSDVNDGRITVCLSADRNFAFPLAVTLASLRALHAVDQLRVVVLADGFDGAARQAVCGAVGGALEIDWVDMRRFDLGAVKLRWPEVITRATCFRLLVPQVLPPGTERAIYLDCDMVVCQSLTDLWHAPLADGQLVGAVYDAYVPWAAAPDGTNWRELGLPPAMPYFNAGVMIIPVRRWLDLDLGARAIRLMAEHEMVYADQCALNAVVRGAWLPLQPKWNLQTPHVTGWHYGWVVYGKDAMQAALDDPAIVHFSSGDSKPWKNSSHPLAHRWYQALDLTAWRGWRPRSDGQPTPLPLV